jgi:DNA-binding transcriptional MerR regulator
MLISAFARSAGLSVDTVRFYIDKGLLTPQRTAKGGSRPYQVFSEADLTAARMIRLQQSLGYSLAEIAALNREYRSGVHSASRTAAALRQQIARLETKQHSIDAALNFLNAKLQWVEAGKPADAPHFEDYFC